MLIKKFIKKNKGRPMLTEFLEKDKVNLIHGESGSGKTYYILKHLNENKVPSYLADFDDNQQIVLNEQGLNTTVLDGNKFLKYLLYFGDKEVPISKQLLEETVGKVIIIDTWALFVRELFDGDELEALLNLQRVASTGITFIVLAHTISFSGKDAIPEMDSKVYKHINTRLYIRRVTRTNDIVYDLIVEKVRGYSGPKILPIRIEKK